VPGDTKTWIVNPGAPGNRLVTATITSRLFDTRNGDNCISIELRRAAATVLPAGEWALHLESNVATPVPFHCWIERGKGGPTFTSHVSRNGTITAPGTSQQVITVGGYSQSGFLFWDWSGDLGGFSSYGPTRDNRRKPDISAPGNRITSAKTQVGDSCCCDCCRDFYTDTTKEEGEFSGTSMAAPHVTGVVALMFEQDRTLNAALVKDRLMKTARIPDGVNAAQLPNDEWGAGKVDAFKVVTSPPPNPVASRPAGGSGSGGTVLRLDLGDPGGAHLGARALDLLARQALASPEGQRWSALVSRHFSEVRGLINHNKRVAVAWHRIEGPRLLRELQHARAIGDVVALIDDATSEEGRARVARFLDLLDRYGSAELRRDVAANREAIVRVGLDELHAFLARLDPAA
jgi:hypothetical protein